MTPAQHAEPYTGGDDETINDYWSAMSRRFGHAPACY